MKRGGNCLKKKRTFCTKLILYRVLFVTLNDIFIGTLFLQQKFWKSDLGLDLNLSKTYFFTVKPRYDENEGEGGK